MAGNGFMLKGFGLLNRLERPVSVMLPLEGESDDYGMPVEGFAPPVTVQGCLVARGATEDLDAGRPDGATVSYTVHFPSSFTGNLRGAKVRIDDGWLDVVGDPRTGASPLGWNRPVEVGYVEG